MVCSWIREVCKSLAGISPNTVTTVPCSDVGEQVTNNQLMIIAGRKCFIPICIFVSRGHILKVMKRIFKIILIAVISLVAIAVVAGLGGWLYLKATFLDFEDDYAERIEFERRTVDGYAFLDRNGNGELDIYEDSRAPVEARVEDLLAQMTMEEKIHLLKGSGIASAAGMVDPGAGIPGAVGTIVPTPRLGIPTVYLSDGPAGLRIQPTRENEDRTYYCTAFPIATLLASTWNEDLVQEVGNAMGREYRGGLHLL